jgi:hypothetical protein
MCLLIAKIKEFNFDPSEIIPLFNKLGVMCISHVVFTEESDFAHLKPVQSRLFKRLIQSRVFQRYDDNKVRVFIHKSITFMCTQCFHDRLQRRSFSFILLKFCRDS